MAFSDNTSFQTVTIPSSSTTTPAITMDGLTLCLIKIPSSFTGTGISFQVSLDGGTTYGALYDATNTLVSVTVAVNRVYSVDLSVFACVRNFKIVSNATELASRDIQIAYRPV